MKQRFMLPYCFFVAYCSVVAAQNQRKEYTPSPIVGTEWNAAGNMNPFIPGYFADPTIKKFGDTYYLYTTTDGTGNGYGPAQVWVSKDFVNWKNVVMNWPTTEVVWAPDVVRQPNGKYRYYYCEPCNINIGESDSPTGPWHNILGNEDAVMIPDRYVHNVITLDPQLFTDDDGSQYLYFTTWGIYKGFGCGVAKLKDGDFDIKALAEHVTKDARRWNENRPFHIAADEFFTEKRLIPNTELKDIFEAPFVFKRNGVYYFTYSSGSCHTDTYRVQYATSTVGPMGPFEYKGELLTTNEDETVHGPGHHSVLEQNGKFYIVYHRHNNPKSVHGFNRQICIDELNFDKDGNIIPIIPTHNAQNVDMFKTQKQQNLAYGAKVTASSYYDEWFKPEYAVDDNNATLWKSKNTNWGREEVQPNVEWLQIDLGKVKQFTEIWTQFEYATFFYQYKIEISDDGNNWTMYADRSQNYMQGSPMIDKGKANTRYVRISITDTQKNGHMPAIWNVKIWKKAPYLPETYVESNDGYPGMHRKDVREEERKNLYSSEFVIDASNIAAGKTAPFDFNEIPGLTSGCVMKSNKPVRMRIKDGRWAFFMNGTQYFRTAAPLSNLYKYNSPFTIAVWALQTEAGPVSTLVSLSSSRADLATTEMRLGTNPMAGLMNHNGSFESSGAPKTVERCVGKWHFWTVTYDGWMEKVYLDGKLLQEKNNFLMIRPEGYVTIGADAGGTNNFVGYLSNIVIKPCAANEYEIRNLYESAKDLNLASLGDDDFEEIDPDSKFVLSPDMKLLFEKKDEFLLSTTGASFNENPLTGGGEIYQEVEGDFVVMAVVSDMEGLKQRNVTGYNEGGILLSDDNGTFYQLGAFPLYNCGNMLTVLSRKGRPQFPNYKGYDFDPFIQFERKGENLYARSSKDGKVWKNMPGSPIYVSTAKMQIGAYQTTYTEKQSWVKLYDYMIYK